MKSLQDLIVKSLREETFSPFRIVGKYVKDEKIEACYVFASDTKPKPKPKQGTEKSISNSENLLTRKQLIMKIVQNRENSFVETRSFRRITRFRVICRS